jgi:hypothetical protein
LSFEAEKRTILVCTKEMGVLTVLAVGLYILDEDFMSTTLVKTQRPSNIMQVFALPNYASIQLYCTLRLIAF